MSADRLPLRPAPPCSDARFYPRQDSSRPLDGAGVFASVQTSPPKAHLPGKGAPDPQSGEGGSPFKPGRVREAHCTAGAVGASTPRAKGWRRATATLRRTVDDEVGDVPGWVLITFVTRA